MPKFEAGTFDVIVIGAGHAGVEAAFPLPKWVHQRSY